MPCKHDVDLCTRTPTSNPTNTLVLPPISCRCSSTTLLGRAGHHERMDTHALSEHGCWEGHPLVITG